MTTFKRICIEDSFIESENGERQELKRGQEYITGPIREDGKVIVFSTWWVPFPVVLFAGEKRFT